MYIGVQPHSTELRGAADTYVTEGNNGMSLPHLRDLQPADSLMERDEFGTIYKKAAPQLPRVPGAGRCVDGRRAAPDVCTAALGH